MTFAIIFPAFIIFFNNHLLTGAFPSTVLFPFEVQHAGDLSAPVVAATAAAPASYDVPASATYISEEMLSLMIQ